MKISGEMPKSASNAGVVSKSSSHGDTGEVRKLLGLKKSGDAVGDVVVREHPTDEGRSVVPDNAEAIAWAAAASSTDIGRVADVSPSETVCVCSEVLLEASIVK